MSKIVDLFLGAVDVIDSRQDESGGISITGRSRADGEKVYLSKEKDSPRAAAWRQRDGWESVDERGLLGWIRRLGK